MRFVFGPPSMHKCNDVSELKIKPRRHIASATWCKYREGQLID